MSWTEEDKAYLNSFKRTPDNDDVRFKQKIKEKLLGNRYIIHVLNNKQLDEDEPDSYFNTAILPYFVLEDTIVDVKNLICYEVSFVNPINAYDKPDIMKKCQVIFNVVCDLADIKEDETGIARHDLLAALLIEQFNWPNIFGLQFKLVNDKPGMLGANLASRTLIFEGMKPNSITQTRNGVSRVVNNDVRT